MPNNMRYIDGRRLYGPVEAGTVSGSPCVIGSRAGVAQMARDAANSAVVDFGGVYELTVTGATVPGTPIYYTANADPTLRLGIVATGIFFGYALETQAGPGAGLIDVVVSEASGISTLGAGSLDGTEVSNVANINAIGGIPVLHRVDVADAATGDIDTVITHRTRVLDAWLVKTANASSAHANTIQVSNGANAITNAMSLNNVADTTIVRAGTINDANHEIAAGGTLRIARVRADPAGQVACTVYVLGIRVA